jgi:hypothetical protein
LTGKIPETYLTLYLYADELGAQGISQRFIRENWGLRYTRGYGGRVRRFRT